MSLKDIKAKIKSVGRTRQVTKAMEAVSAVKMRKSQMRAFSGRPYARAALSILSRLVPSLSSVKHLLATERPVRRAALIVVTTDKGLCGVLNAAVLKEAERTLREIALPKEAIEIFAFGRKAVEYFTRRGYTISGAFENISDDVVVTDLRAVSKTITTGFSLGAYDSVTVVYTEFKSTFEQRAVAHRVLPLSLEVLEEVVSGIPPEKGALRAAPDTAAPAYYTVEPSQEEVLATLLPHLAAVIVYHALLESKASEHSARMVAMKNASDKSRDLSKALTRRFNKARQAAITREVSEIVGGIEAMAVS